MLAAKIRARKNDARPCLVWIWDVTKLRHVALLRQIASVRAVTWHPTRTILAVATGSGSVYFWSPNGCLCAQVPADREYCSLLFWD